LFSILINAWKVKEIRQKLMAVLALVAVYRLGAAIPLPGINLVAWQFVRTGGGGFDQTLFATIVGGEFGTIFQMGIGPFITASIIMQLLCVAIPKLEQIQKEGQEGRKKIGRITRFVAVGLALVQGAGTVFSIEQQGLFLHSSWLTWISATTAIVAGSIFVMWLGELITEKGIGNGSSFIIFSNIISGAPAGVMMGVAIIQTMEPLLILAFALLLVLFVGLVAFATLIQDGERRIPVQYSKKMVGRQMYGGQSTYMPIKVNIAGVMSIIFSISLLQLPATMAAFFPHPNIIRLTEILSLTSPVGAVLYAVLIVCFTFFYTSFAVNPVEMAENLKKNGGVIPGVRSGKPTSDYISRTVHRLSVIGAGFYVTLAMAPIIFQVATSLQIGFGGTTLLIMVGVALETVKQLESQLLMRHYKGFLST